MIATAASHVISEKASHSRIPFRRLLFVELRKSIDTRAAQWLVATTVAVMAGLLILGIAMPKGVKQSLPSYMSLASISLAFLFPIVAILALTSEWS